jgi:hypothetical protein
MGLRNPIGVGQSRTSPGSGEVLRACAGALGSISFYSDRVPCAFDPARELPIRPARHETLRVEKQLGSATGTATPASSSVAVRLSIRSASLFRREAKPTAPPSRDRLSRPSDHRVALVLHGATNRRGLLVRKAPTTSPLPTPRGKSWGQSLSMILATPLASARTPPLTFESFPKKRSVRSFFRSPLTATGTVCFIWPGKKVIVFLTAA